jgi:hypothetical protein
MRGAELTDKEKSMSEPEARTIFYELTARGEDEEARRHIDAWYRQRDRERKESEKAGDMILRD